MRGLRRGRPEKVMLSRDPSLPTVTPGLMRVKSGEGASWAEEKQVFLLESWGWENLLPTSESYKGLNKGRLMCEIFSSLCERDSELFSWNLSPAPQAPWKLRAVWFFSCECRPAQYHLDSMVSTSLVRYVKTESVRKHSDTVECRWYLIIFSFYFSIISLGWTKKEANTPAVAITDSLKSTGLEAIGLRKVWALLQLSHNTNWLVLNSSVLSFLRLGAFTYKMGLIVHIH